MSIYKVNDNLPLAEKIRLLNSMVVELDGKIEKARFDKHELEAIYGDLSGTDRKFLRDQVLGGTTSTYTDWTHVSTQTGYSIWKITPTTYTYNAYNQVYLDNKRLELRGQAAAETQSAFSYAYNYNGDSGAGYTDDTTEAGTAGGTEFDLIDSTNDYLYVGLDSTFKGIDFKFETPGSGYTLVIEYYDETSGVADFVPLTVNDDNLEDNTSNFVSDGTILFDIPTDWGLTTVNSQSAYWIRISTSATPVSTAAAYQITPANNVPSLLGLSSSQVQSEDWAWCEYSGAVYVTIRNAGNTNYEGNYYITSSSTSTNLQNFFIHNHQFTSDYQDSTY